MKISIIGPLQCLLCQNLHPSSCAKKSKFSWRFSQMFLKFEMFHSYKTTTKCFMALIFPPIFMDFPLALEMLKNTFYKLPENEKRPLSFLFHFWRTSHSSFFFHVLKKQWHIPKGKTRTRCQRKIHLRGTRFWHKSCNSDPFWQQALIFFTSLQWIRRIGLQCSINPYCRTPWSNTWKTF